MIFRYLILLVQLVLVMGACTKSSKSNAQSTSGEVGKTEISLEKISPEELKGKLCGTWKRVKGSPEEPRFELKMCEDGSCSLICVDPSIVTIGYRGAYRIDGINISFEVGQDPKLAGFIKGEVFVQKIVELTGNTLHLEVAGGEITKYTR